ncbi:unnamed protein product, partial [Amoebophrya sp. A120]|eukprot:GSA120T00017861001.1
MDDVDELDMIRADFSAPSPLQSTGMLAPSQTTRDFCGPSSREEAPALSSWSQETSKAAEVAGAGAESCELQSKNRAEHDHFQHDPDVEILFEENGFQALSVTSTKKSTTGKTATSTIPGPRPLHTKQIKLAPLTKKVVQTPTTTASSSAGSEQEPPKWSSNDNELDGPCGGVKTRASTFSSKKNSSTSEPRAAEHELHNSSTTPEDQERPEKTDDNFARTTTVLANPNKAPSTTSTFRADVSSILFGGSAATSFGAYSATATGHPGHDRSRSATSGISGRNITRHDSTHRDEISDESDVNEESFENSSAANKARHARVLTPADSAGAGENRKASSLLPPPVPVGVVASSSGSGAASAFFRIEEEDPARNGRGGSDDGAAHYSTSQEQQQGSPYMKPSGGAAGIGSRTRIAATRPAEVLLQSGAGHQHSETKAVLPPSEGPEDEEEGGQEMVSQLPSWHFAHGAMTRTTAASRKNSVEQSSSSTVSGLARRRQVTTSTSSTLGVLCNERGAQQQHHPTTSSDTSSSPGLHVAPRSHLRQESSVKEKSSTVYASSSNEHAERINTVPGADRRQERTTEKEEHGNNVVGDRGKADEKKLQLDDPPPKTANETRAGVPVSLLNDLYDNDLVPWTTATQAQELGTAATTGDVSPMLDFQCGEQQASSTNTPVLLKKQGDHDHKEQLVLLSEHPSFSTGQQIMPKRMVLAPPQQVEQATTQEDDRDEVGGGEATVPHYVQPVDQQPQPHFLDRGEESNAAATVNAHTKYTESKTKTSPGTVLSTNASANTATSRFGTTSTGTTAASGTMQNKPLRTLAFDVLEDNSTTGEENTNTLEHADGAQHNSSVLVNMNCYDRREV